MSCLAAWKTLVTSSLAISPKNGSRSMSSASGSISAVAPGEAIWIRQSSGQKVVSRMNSVSTVTKSDFPNSRMAASSSDCLVITCI